MKSVGEGVVKASVKKPQRGCQVVGRNAVLRHEKLQMSCISTAFSFGGEWPWYSRGAPVDSYRGH